MKSRMPLRARIFLTTAISSLIPLLLAITILHFSFIYTLEKQIANQAMDIASLAVARNDVRQAYDTNDYDTLIKIADDIQVQTRAAFVVFMDMDGIRISHPNKILIGLSFSGGDEGPALKGESYTSHAVGISGPSIRAFRPIYGQNNQQVGVLAVGFYQPDISIILSKINQTFYLLIPISLFLIVFFSIILANNVKKLMFGMEPLEIATLLKERDTILFSVKEGVIAIDQDCRITMVNMAASQLFEPNQDLIGKDIRELIPDSQLPTVMENRQSQEDQQLLINESVVLTNRLPLIIEGKVVGAIATFRPLTEVNRIAEELTGVKAIVNALRARTHEFLNKLHVISGLIQLEAYDDARKYIADLTSRERNLVSFIIDHIHSHTVAGLLMGKASEAEEKHIHFTIDSLSNLYTLPDNFDEHAVVVVLGNLIENAFDAVAKKTHGRNVNVLIKQEPTEITFEVSDQGPGIPMSVRPRIFDAGFTTKENGMGFGLANLQSLIKVAGGKVEIISSDRGTTFRIVIPYQFASGERKE